MRALLSNILSLQVFLLCSLLLITTSTFAANQVTGLRVAPNAEGVRVVVEVKQAADFSYFSLKSPDRLVIDFNAMSQRVDFSAYANKSPLIKKIRQSKAKQKSGLRMVLDLNKPLKTRVFSLDPSDDFGHRVVIDLIDPSPQAVSKVIKNGGPQRDKDIVIVLDAGHGGADPGSLGPAGTYEKHITLSIAKILEAQINKTPGMRAVMTRTGDYYISPNDRPDVATRENADLLVSIHADAFTSPQPRGGSVWVLSKGRADSELGRLLEQTERSSELIGSAANVIEDRDTERYFAETIFNMSMDLSRASSYDFSNKVIREMKKVTKMHKRTPQSASFAVLTAPETPSVLVEVGFISNPQEEKNLNWKAYRERLANAMYSSISSFFKANPPEGTLWADLRNNAPIEHKVKSGESLSLLAQRYQVKVKDIKTLNRLNSDMVRVGQTLTIPNH